MCPILQLFGVSSTQLICINPKYKVNRHISAFSSFNLQVYHDDDTQCLALQPTAASNIKHFHQTFQLTSGILEGLSSAAATTKIVQPTSTNNTTIKFISPRQSNSPWNGIQVRDHGLQMIDLTVCKVFSIGSFDSSFICFDVIVTFVQMTQLW